ncbi:MAG: Wzz/FepE/Etk N-terminal domain-containing protein [Chitinophagaceae bacterium]
MTENKDEISLRELVSKLNKWIKYLISKWLIICIVGIIGGSVGFLYAYTSTPKYSASLSFILSGNTQSSGLYGLASQFGIDVGGSSDDVFTGDNIISLMSSRRMVQTALLKKPEGTNQTLLNLFATDSKLNEGWQKLERTKGAFPFPDDTAKMTLVQDSLFRSVYDDITKSNLDVSKPDKNENIYVVITTSKNETFSYYLTNYLVSTTSAFYIDTKTKLARQNLKMLQHEADSLLVLLGGAIASSAAETDRTFNLNPAYQVQRSGAQESQARATVVGTAYGEVVKNLEIAKITLQKETPLYQIIDEPQLPLIAEKPGKLTSLIIGGFLSGFIIVCILIIRKLVSNFKRNETQQKNIAD